MEPFKNVFSPSLVVLLSDNVHRVDQGFDRDGFVAAVMRDLEGLELKDRVQLLADMLAEHLPSGTLARLRILEAILHPEEGDSPQQSSDRHGMRGFAVWPLTLVVGQHGRDEFDASLNLLRAMTKRFTSEFGIRYFLLDDQPRTLAAMTAWVADTSHHVRRLVSEGTRPRLPWAPQLPNLIEDPAPMLPILERLRDDPEEYVRRSVANHLNDISKDHPDLVADIALTWADPGNQARQRLLRHACRSLIKTGHPGALQVFGHGAPEIQIADFQVTPERIELGQSVELSAHLTSRSAKPQSLVVDIVAHFLKANGQYGAKVFKGSHLTLGPKEVAHFKRKLPLRPITTRRYYSGRQRLSLRINGQDFGDVAFDLAVP